MWSDYIKVIGPTLKLMMLILFLHTWGAELLVQTHFTFLWSDLHSEMPWENTAVE